MTRLALLACVLLLPTAAIAADEPGPGVQAVTPTTSESIQAYTSQLLQLNQINPAQNPLYTLGSRAISFRLLDQNRRALGKLSDITIGAGGALESVQAQIMSTGFDQELNFGVVAHNVTPESDAYSVTLTRDQVEDNLPGFLAATESAAGDDDNGPITVQSLIGARVQNAKGSQIAIVDDVMIDDQQKMAVALLLTLMGGSGQTTIAVPYRSAKVARTGPKATVELTDEQARVVTNYAPKR